MARARAPMRFSSFFLTNKQLLRKSEQLIPRIPASFCSSSGFWSRWLSIRRSRQEEVQRIFRFSSFQGSCGDSLSKATTSHAGLGYLSRNRLGNHDHWLGMNDRAYRPAFHAWVPFAPAVLTDAPGAYPVAVRVEAAHALAMPHTLRVAVGHAAVGDEELRALHPLQA